MVHSLSHRLNCAAAKFVPKNSNPNPISISGMACSSTQWLTAVLRGKRPSTWSQASSFKCCSSKAECYKISNVGLISRNHSFTAVMRNRKKLNYSSEMSGKDSERQWEHYHSGLADTMSTCGNLRTRHSKLCSWSISLYTTLWSHLPRRRNLKRKLTSSRKLRHHWGCTVSVHLLAKVPLWTYSWYQLTDHTTLSKEGSELTVMGSAVQLDKVQVTVLENVACLIWLIM